MKKSTKKTAVRMFREVVRIIKLKEAYSGVDQNGHPYTLRSMFAAPVESASTSTNSDPLGIGFVSAARGSEGEAYNALTFDANTIRALNTMGSGDYTLIEGVEKFRTFYSPKEGKNISKVDVEFFSATPTFKADQIATVIKAYITPEFNRQMVTAGSGSSTAGIVAAAAAQEAQPAKLTLTPAEKGALTKAKNKAAKLAAKSAPAQPADVDDIPF